MNKTDKKNIFNSVEEQATLAKNASFKLAASECSIRNKALKAIADSLNKNRTIIFDINKQDMNAAEKEGLGKPLVKRLLLNDNKINSLIKGIEDLIGLEDPIGRELDATELDDGLILKKISVPIGLIGVIFESRPDALVQIVTLCIKSGNAVILKGGREASRTNLALYNFICDALNSIDSVFKNTVQLVETREEIWELLKLDNLVDLMIPRGSNELVRTIKNNTRIPVLGHADGICHLYINEDADPEMAVELTYDSKCQYPAVCNALETLLIHKNIAGSILEKIKSKLEKVELRGDERTLEVIAVNKASEDDWGTEYNDLILSIKIIDSTEEAIEHINKYGSHHTDAIVTKNKKIAEYFMNQVDSSSVLWNCSTRFSDGFRYGFGAEVGISTNKIHARGPVGLEGLTIYKFKLKGSGQIVSDYANGIKSFCHKKIK